ncbi:hypothetical protein [Erysipelothrix sp. P66]|uniref:hypothetical protein n=1 Tax=Erysipelothrix sp. P66 TaxID=3141531 RepID=UPI00315CEC98
MFKTLIKEENNKNRWYPTSVNSLERSILLGSYKERKNFAYSMQYLQYLELQFDELNLSEVLFKINIKSYIVTGMGIIEMLFKNLLHDTGNWNRTTWIKNNDYETNSKKKDGKKVKLKIEEFVEVKEYDMRMDFDSMIKKVDSKKLLSIKSNNFPAVKKLKVLRNKVHLQINDDKEDHDYNSFDLESLQMMRRILYAVLITEEIQNPLGVGKFDFIIEAYNKRINFEKTLKKTPKNV